MRIDRYGWAICPLACAVWVACRSESLARDDATRNAAAEQAVQRLAPAPSGPSGAQPGAASPGASSAAAPGVPLVSSAAPSGPGPSPTPASSEPLLSFDWARQRRDESKAADRALAEAMRVQGHAAYQQRKDVDAAALYEQALAAYPSGQLYYDYANALSNVGRLADSVQAYELALSLEFEHPELALYNEACALSRLQDAAGGFAKLEQAVDAGYLDAGGHPLSKLEQDPDLAFLHARPEWKARFARLAGSPEILVGTLVLHDDRTSYPYVVCPNGIVEGREAAGLDESCCGTRKIGRLSVENGRFVAHWLQRCGRTGTGGRESPGERDVCQTYRGCSPDEVCQNYVADEALLSVADARAMLARPSAEPEPGDWEHATSMTPCRRSAALGSSRGGALGARSRWPSPAYPRAAALQAKRPITSSSPGP